MHVNGAGSGREEAEGRWRGYREQSIGTRGHGIEAATVVKANVICCRRVKRSADVEPGSGPEDPTGSDSSETDLPLPKFCRLYCPKYVGDLVAGDSTENILDAAERRRGTAGRRVAKVRGIACADI